MSEFDDATHVAEDGSAQIAPGWDIGGNANGGYLMALAAQGLRGVAARPDPLTITAHYLAPGTPGPVTVEGAVVKAGKRYTTVTGSLRRGDTRMLQLVATFGDVAAMQGGYQHVAGRPPELPPFEECVQRSAQQGPVRIAIMDRLNLRLHPDDAGFSVGQRSGTAQIRGWFAFADGRPLDTLALLLVGDAFPPSVFNLDIAEGWVPTLEYTVHVRGIPAPGPLRVVLRSRFVQNGAFEEDAEMWDSADRLVAISRQYGLLPR
jgi:ribosome modulation factor